MNRRSFLGGLLALLVARKLPRPTIKPLTLLDVAKIHEPKTLPVVEALQSSDQTSIWLVSWSDKDPKNREFYEHRWSALSPLPDWKKEWETIRKRPNWFKRSIRGI